MHGEICAPHRHPILAGGREVFFVVEVLSEDAKRLFLVHVRRSDACPLVNPQEFQSGQIKHTSWRSDLFQEIKFRHSLELERVRTDADVHHDKVQNPVTSSC